MPSRPGLRRPAPTGLRAGSPGPSGLALFNSVVAVYVGLPFLAPVLMRAGLERPARWIYVAYSFVCHQWPFRSFFLFGPRATYPRDILQAATGVDPIPSDILNARTFIGNAATGFKVALCERDVAMYAGILLAGLAFGVLRPHLKPLHWDALAGAGRPANRARRRQSAHQPTPPRTLAFP